MLTTWNALPTLDRLVDDVMKDVVGAGHGAARTAASYRPTTDIRANDERIAFVCDVPGLKREDLDISVDANVLTLQGTRRYEASEKDRVLLGRAYGSFTQRFALPEGADVEAVTADLTDGVLTITVPLPPKAKPRRITIGTSKTLGEGSDEKE